MYSPFCFWNYYFRCNVVFKRKSVIFSLGLSFLARHRREQQIKTEPAPPSHPSKVDMSNYFYIQSQLNHFVLTIDGFKLDGDLVMYPAYGGANQLWKWGPDDTLVSKMGLVADIKDDNSGSGASCIGWFPNGGANQKWKYENGAIKSTMNGLVMDIAEGDAKVSACVQMWEESGNLNQEWLLVPENKL